MTPSNPCTHPPDTVGHYKKKHMEMEVFTFIFHLSRDMKFTKGHRSSKAVTILTLPNFAKILNFLPHRPCADSLCPEAWVSVASGCSVLRDTLATRSVRLTAPAVLLKATCTQVSLLLTRLLFGGTGHNGTFSQ